jgi:hypothetical protein
MLLDKDHLLAKLSSLLAISALADEEALASNLLAADSGCGAALALALRVPPDFAGTTEDCCCDAQAAAAAASATVTTADYC